MTMKKIAYIAGILMLVMPVASSAQALPFTAVEMDAVTLAKGGASLTETGSVAGAAFSNAAVIPFSESRLDASAGYTRWQPTSGNVISAAGAYTIDDKVGVALGFNYGLNRPYELAGDSYMPTDMQVSAGVSWRFLPFLAVGANLGYAGSRLAHGHAYNAFNSDLFLMGKVAGFKIAAGMSNLGSKITSASGEEFSLPTSLSLGLGYDKVFAQKHGVDVLADVDYYLAGNVRVAAGASYTYNDFVTVRAGCSYGTEGLPLFGSVGLGVKYSGIRLNLVYLMGAEVINNSFGVSVGYTF